MHDGNSWESFEVNSDFSGWQITHPDIHQGSHGEDKQGVQVSEKVSLCRKNGEEVAAKREAGKIGDDKWYCAANPTEDHSWQTSTPNFRLQTDLI